MGMRFAQHGFSLQTVLRHPYHESVTADVALGGWLAAYGTGRFFFGLEGLLDALPAHEEDTARRCGMAGVLCFLHADACHAPYARLTSRNSGDMAALLHPS